MAVFASVGPKQVKGIIKTQLEDSEIESAISTAMVLIEHNLSGENIPSNVLVEITMYLSAHFVALRDDTTRIKMEKIGDASVEFQTNESPMDFSSLKSTKWGAVAVSLDPTGILQQLGLKKPKLCHLGPS